MVAANSSTRLDSDRQARANSAVDGNPATAWIAETGPQAGEWLSYGLDKPVRIDHLTLKVVNDGRHSLPTRLTLTTEAGSRTVVVPPIPVGYGRPQGSTTTVRLAVAALTGSHIKLTIDAVQEVRALDYYATFSRVTDILPVGIAELGLPVVQPPAPTVLPANCQSGLLRIDGRPVDVAIIGTTADALAGQGPDVAAAAGTPRPESTSAPARTWSRPALGCRAAGGSSVWPWRRRPRRRRRPHRVRPRGRCVSTSTTGPRGRSLSTATASRFGWSWARARARAGRPPWPAGAAWDRPSSSTAARMAGTWRRGRHGPTVIHVTSTPQRVVWAAIGV